MHICFLCNEYPPSPHGGVGTFTQTLGRALVARGHSVSAVGVYRIPKTRVQSDKGINVARLRGASMGPFSLFINALRLRAALSRLQRASPVDIVEGPEYSMAALARRTPYQKIIRMHGGHHFFRAELGMRPARGRRLVEGLSFRNADALCAVSRHVAERTRELLHLGDRNIEIIPNPVDTERFRPMPEIPEEPGLLTFVGTVCEKKGVRQLVEAMPMIVERVPHARLEIVGPDWRDPATGSSYVDGLRQRVDPAVAGKVAFLGPVENSRLPEILARAEILVYPSHTEAMPVAWLEGLAMGKPVIASRLGPGPEVIGDGISGLLCDPHDPSSIAEGVISLLLDPDARRRMGENARVRAEEEFSVEVLIGKNEEFYRRCAPPPQSGEENNQGLQ